MYSWNIVPMLCFIVTFVPIQRPCLQGAKRREHHLKPRLPTCLVLFPSMWEKVWIIGIVSFLDDLILLQCRSRTEAPLHKICVWTQIRKIKRKSLMRDSDWLKIHLHLIFLICVQTQIFLDPSSSILRTSLQRVKTLPPPSSKWSMINFQKMYLHS